MADSGGFWGGGGGSAAVIEAFFKRSELGTTENVTVGLGGALRNPTGALGGFPGTNSLFRNMIAGGGGGGGSSIGAHGPAGIAGVATVAGPGRGIGLRGSSGVFGARWDVPSAMGVYGKGGAPGGMTQGFGGQAGENGFVSIEEYILS